MIMKDICDLEPKTREVFEKLRFAENTILQMLFVVRKLVRLHDEQYEKQWNSEIVYKYINHQEMRYQNGEIGKRMFLMRKTTIDYLKQIHETGTVAYQRHNKCRITLPDCFEGILSDILSNTEWSPKAGKWQHSYTSLFFRWLYSYGYIDLSLVDEHVVREYLMDCSSRMTIGSLDSTRRALKRLFLFLSEDGTLTEQINKLFLFKIPVDRKIMPLMPQNEIAAILNVIDKNTVKGKRDYAIILLAAVTGLRGVDIVELALDSIDWRNGEIRIVQEKTGKALALPLTTDVGEAVREYVLNARPHSSKSNQIFLSTKPPFRAICSSTPSCNLKNYRIKAGLSAKRCFHSLRRSIATNMVTSGVSVITVAQTLGHTTIDSTKQYIYLDSKNLKKCALDFSGIPIGGGTL
jgi:site-specific recombinase XerD